TPTSAYSFDGAFISIHGDYRAKPLAKITATAPRGSRTVELDNASRLAVGASVLVIVHETPDHSLKTWLYNNDPGDISHGKQLDTKMLVRVVALDGRRATFDRPLRFEPRAAWRAEVRSFEPTVSEGGTEHLRFEFPATKYRGHFHESGYNAIELRDVTDCWVRDVVIHNGDLGVNVVA